MIFPLAQLDFAHPGRLAALCILPLVVLVAYRYARFDAAWQRTASLACRLALVALLIAALAGPLYRQASPEKFVAFAVDDSASLSEETRAAARKFIEQAKAAGGGSNSVAYSFGGNTVLFDDAVDRLSSDPAWAVMAAASTLPTNYVTEVVLLSDGRQTRGSLLTAAERAGVPVSVVPLTAFSEPEVGIESVVVPAEARPGETVSLQVVVAANGAGSGQVEVTNTSTKKIVSRPLEVVAGTNRITLSAECGAEKATTFEVRLTGFPDHHAENNLAAAVVQTLPALRVLLVDADAARAGRLSGVLKQQGVETITLAPSALPKLAAGLAANDVVVLSSPDPKTLSPEQASALATFVRGQGGGLIVLGQAATFGAESYQASSLEALLPVAALSKAEERKPVLALTLIIDRSDSMREEDRLVLAKEAAKQVVEFLTPQDKIGIIGFDGASEWISEIYPCSDKPELLRRIARLKAGGQTDLYPPMVKAYLAMEQADADRRHVILLTDANFSFPGDFQRIAAQMSEAGITMSTVSISKGAEQTLLKDISKAAGGRHFHCDNPADIPSVLVRETKSVAAVAASEFQPRVFRQLPGLDVAAAPLLTGAVAVNPKTRAEILLQTVDRDPLLSWWRYGDGVTVALAADVQPWQSWPGYGKFWSRLISHAAKDSTPRGYSFQLSRQGDKGFATLKALSSDGKFLNSARATVELNGARPLELAQVAPGRYQAEFDIAAPGTYEATVHLFDPQSSSTELYKATRSLVLTYPDELRVGPTNEALLREVARVSGGTYDPQPEAVFAPTDRTVDRETPLALFFVLAAALVLVADVAVRRYHELFGAASAAERKQLDQGNHVGGANEAA